MQRLGKVSFEGFITESRRMVEDDINFKEYIPYEQLTERFSQVSFTGFLPLKRNVFISK
jgi:hypothetical protein